MGVLLPCCADVDLRSIHRPCEAAAWLVLGVVGKDTVQVRKKFDRTNQQAGGKQEAIVIAASELNRLRDNAKLLTKEEEMEQKQRQEVAYAERMQKSIARKEKIRQMEEERKKNAMLVDSNKDGRAQKNSVLETGIWHGLDQIGLEPGGRNRPGAVLVSPVEPRHRSLCGSTTSSALPPSMRNHDLQQPCPNGNPRA